MVMRFTLINLTGYNPFFFVALVSMYMFLVCIITYKNTFCSVTVFTVLMAICFF